MDDHAGPRIAVVGAGRAGASLGRALHAQGYPITAVWSRTSGRAASLAAELGAVVATTPGDAAAQAELTILAVVDVQITPVCREIAAYPNTHPAAVVHVSGVSGRDVLQPLAAAGYQVGAFHPLQTFADDRSPIVPGTTFAIEADEPLRAVLAHMARALGGTPLDLAADDRALYHAAATITANYTITLMQQASSLLEACGLSREQSLRALLPLLRGTVDNLARVGLPEALTGPVVRGDTATVARHLAALAERAPTALPIYRALGVATAELAGERGTGSEQLAEIAMLLREFQPALAEAHE